MKFKKSVPIILAALALSAALIGCSGGDTSSGSQTTDSSVTATANASPEDIAAKMIGTDFLNFIIHQHSFLNI